MHVFFKGFLGTWSVFILVAICVGVIYAAGMVFNATNSGFYAVTTAVFGYSVVIGLVCWGSKRMGK